MTIDEIESLCLSNYGQKDLIKDIEKVVSKTGIDVVVDHNRPLVDIVEDFVFTINWRLISDKAVLSFRFIEAFQEHIDWKNLCESQPLTLKTLRTFREKLDWDSVCYNTEIPEKNIWEFERLVNWDVISWNYKLSTDFMKAYADRLNWDFISEYQAMDIDFVITFSHKLNIEKMAINVSGASKFVKILEHRSDFDLYTEMERYWKKYRLSSSDKNADFCNPLDIESCYDEFTKEGNIDWKRLSVYGLFSMKFIRKFEDYIDWKAFSRRIIVTDFEEGKVYLKVIRQYKDRLDWVYITDRCCRSYDCIDNRYIEEFWEYLQLNVIIGRNLLSNDFLNRLTDADSIKKELIENIKAQSTIKYSYSR